MEREASRDAAPRALVDASGAGNGCESPLLDRASAAVFSLWANGNRQRDSGGSAEMEVDVDAPQETSSDMATYSATAAVAGGALTVHAPSDELLVRLVIEKTPFVGNSEAKWKAWGDVLSRWNALAGVDAPRKPLDITHATRRLTMLVDIEKNRRHPARAELTPALRDLLGDYRVLKDKLKNNKTHRKQPEGGSRLTQRQSLGDSHADAETDAQGVLGKIKFRSRRVDLPVDEEIMRILLDPQTPKPGWDVVASSLSKNYSNIEDRIPITSATVKARVDWLVRVYHGRTQTPVRAMTRVLAQSIHKYLTGNDVSPELALETKEPRAPRTTRSVDTPKRDTAAVKPPPTAATRTAFRSTVSTVHRVTPPSRTAQPPRVTAMKPPPTAAILPPAVASQPEIPVSYASLIMQLNIERAEHRAQIQSMLAVQQSMIDLLKTEREAHRNERQAMILAFKNDREDRRRKEMAAAAKADLVREMPQPLAADGGDDIRPSQQLEEAASPEDDDGAEAEPSSEKPAKKVDKDGVLI